VININKFKKAFTLVELLIVIGLLGAIALIVIAAINPIEQSNRARDTRFKADGGQLISAIDRYFTARSEFPWVTSGTATSIDESYGFITSSNVDVGICGAACSADGLLLSTNELKSEFRNRDFIQNSTNLDQQIMIGKGAGSSSSVYACFIPLAKATREKAIADGKVYTLSAADGTRTVTAACDVATANWVTNACYVCIPE